MAEPNFQDFIAGNPDRAALMQRGMRNQNMGSQPFADPFRRGATTLGNNIGGFGAQGLPLGLSTLNEILLGQGKTDPRERNRALTNVGRDTEAQQIGNTQSAAQRGLGNSGVTQAINAAIGAAGGDRAAAVESDFIQKEEQRKRDDLLLMLQLLINPALQGSNIAAGLSAQSIQGDAARNQATTQLIGTLGAAGIAACWVARSIYGESDPRWLAARHYVMALAPNWFRSFYIKHGEKIASWLDRHTWAKRFIRPFFDRMVDEARRDLVVV